MSDSLELFDTVTNVHFREFMENGWLEEETFIFTLVERNKEAWNRKAIIQNTKMFIKITGKQPNDYEEVRSWINGNKENSSTRNTEAFRKITN